MSLCGQLFYRCIKKRKEDGQQDDPRGRQSACHASLMMYINAEDSLSRPVTSTSSPWHMRIFTILHTATSTRIHFLNEKSWAGKMAQKFKAIATLSEDPGSISSTHIAAHSHLQTPDPWNLMPSSDLSEH